MKPLYQKNILSASVSMMMTLVLCQSVATQASDIEIYSNAGTGKTAILLMLDTSGSMGISSLVVPKDNPYGSPGDVDASLCDQVAVQEYQNNRISTNNIYEWAYNLKDSATNKTAIKKSVIIGTTSIPYYVRGCTKGGISQYDRLSRLKDAILPLLASNELSDEVIMGLGQFSSKTELKIGTASNTLTDGHSGRILVPNKPLTIAQRISIAQEIAAIKSLDTLTDEDGTRNDNLKLSSNKYPNVTKVSGGTPTAHAYAEAGAYMMGTGTGSSGKNTGTVSTIYDGYMVMQNGTQQAYFICVEVGTGLSSALGATVKQCVNNWPSYDSSKKTIGADNVSGVYGGAQKSGTVYKPDGNGGWRQIKGQTDFKQELKAAGVANGEMSSGWDVFHKLPVGWRYGGWMRVAHEPLDIEPIVGTVWTGYAGNTIGIVSYRTSPFLVGGTTDSMIGGFAFSNSTDIKNGNVYKAGGSTNTCNGNGIYFLTDGAPNSTKDTMAQTIMNTTLSTSAYQFFGKPSGTSVLSSPKLQSGLFSGETGGWEYIGEYSKKLLDPTKNPAKMKIKTAVVGFGSSFAGLTENTDGTYNCASAPNEDAKNACLWGSKEYGDGGFYYAEDSDDIKNSILDFVNNVTPPFEPVATGSPTLPQDALNPLRIQPYGYYASFTPTPQEQYKLWVGNLNKYHVKDGELYNSSKTSRLIENDGSLNANVHGIWGQEGMKGELALGLGLDINNQPFARRTIFTNRQISSSAPYTATESSSLKKINVATLFGAGTEGIFTNDQDKNYWLNLLGYNVESTATGITLDSLPASDLRQLGSNMHSRPILLTQRGKVMVDATGALDTTDRDDYLLFGTTQGLLHVVDVKTGKEKFAFAPHEMLVKQKDAFLENNKTSGGISNLFYGIDAPWTAHSQYVSKSDGTLTVNDSGRTVKQTNNGDEIALKGLQWVYGGLRMGGSSYYALDLSDLDKPSLKFHIDPENSQIYESGKANPTAVTALSYMGQSWSKPTLAYVNFGGEKKLVMFVGGGYDAGYEDAAYKQTNKVGAGVYMFDANTGDLLWWTSANAKAPGGAEAYTDASASMLNMKYSVVSQINAIDRDNDGLVDNLYFGDLAGQGFRVDLNNNAVSTSNFATRVVRLFDQNVDDGASPRFYEMPSVSIHEDNGYVAAVAFSSGNRSNPLSGSTGKNQFGSTTSAVDGVFVVYDKDVAKKDLYEAPTLQTQNIALKSLNSAISTGVPVAENQGWKYTYSNVAGAYKGMNELYALDGMLYVNVYHRDGDGISGKCGSGVKGDSYVYQFCLPTGKCEFTTTTNGAPNRTKLGAGILGTGLGQGWDNDSTKTGLIVNKEDGLDCDAATSKHLPECQLFTTKPNLRQLRWYEMR